MKSKEEKAYDYAVSVWCTNPELEKPTFEQAQYHRKIKNTMEDYLRGWKDSSELPNSEQWITGNVPKDGTTIQRWHWIHNCPISVRYSPNEFGDWVEATQTTVWPEEAFTDHWMPLPDKPNSEPEPERSVARDDDSSNAAGPTPDSLRLKQARERLRYREALEKIVETFDKFKSPVNAAEMMKTLALKALQEEGK